MPLPETINLERPARREHGDWSSNVALATAKKAGWNPRELAGQLAEILNADLPAHVTSVEIAGPGFVNFRLADSWLHDVLVEVVARRVSTATPAPTSAPARKVMVEFVSANPTGPLHAGHGRGAAYGDSLARVLERVRLRRHPRELPQRPRHADAAVRRVARGPPAGRGRARGRLPRPVHHRLGRRDPRARRLDELLEWGEARAVEDHRETLARMNVHFDPGSASGRWSSPAPSRPTLADLRERGVVYDHDGAVWLRTTDFGDDKDRVLVKSDGEFTYLLPDIAYHRDKFARGFDLLIDVWGADHHGYVPRMKAAMQALGHDPDELECADHPAGQPAPGRRAGALLQADRRHHRAAPTCSTRSAPTRPGSPTCCSRSTPPRPSTSTSSRARPRTTRSSTSRWPTPGSGRSSGWPPSGASSASRSSRSTSRCSSTSASSTCCACCPSCPTRWWWRPPTGRRTASPRGCASSPARSTASTTTATSWVRACSPSSPRPGCGWSRRPRSAWPSGSTCSGSARPSQM